ncbi:MAG: penicillin acylase family protein [Bacteroidia bacterium]|nr:penicillin acylase family protein [Bacteroidia bacterium]
MRNLLFLLLFSLLSFHSSFAQYGIDPQNITIARDKWGTPHIFGKTDAEAAYGLAWANSEDNFAVLQEVIVTVTGEAARYKGKEGAISDFFVHAIGAKELIEENYETAITPEYKRYLEGYCQGFNDYAKAHPDQVIFPKIFPTQPKDLLYAFVVSFAALSGVAGAVENAVKGKFDKEPVAFGSNAFAFSPAKTEDGRTYLCINPHFRLEGPFSFYEAHIASEEGLNITGAIFQGGPSIFMGNNKDLGWGMTWNYFDRVDVFKLKMHPKKKGWYELDGQYLKLRKRPVWLKVKVGKLVVPVQKTTWWSEHGPVLESKNGDFYAIRAGAFQNIGAGQEFYYMDKATNYDEFKKALDQQCIAMFNIVYADREGNIYYVSNGLMPNRNPSYDYQKVVPGHKSDAIWKSCISVDSLPHVFNPDCGYVYNTNNTVYHATCEGENDDPNRLPKWADERFMGDNNRSTRLKEQIEERDKVSFEYMKAIKFDNRISRNTHFFSTVKPMLEIDPLKYPDLAEQIEFIKGWDLQADLDSREAAYYEVALHHLFDKKGYGDGAFIRGVTATEDDFVESIRFAKNWLMEHHGTWKIPLMTLHRYAHGGKTYPSYGFPDVLAASYAEPDSDGTFHMMYGDTYIQFVSFGKDGPERIESLLPYGPQVDQPQYENQLNMYNRLETKPMSLDKEQVLKEAKKVYHPGE